MSEVTQRSIDEILTSSAMALASDRITTIKEQLEESEEFEQKAIASAERAVEAFLKRLDPKEPKPQFSNVVEFVEKLIAPLYPYTADTKSQVKWTQYWWKHQEAVYRLTGLWHRYEQLRIAEPATYTETFLRLHADYHMRILMAPDGVFDACRREDQPSIPLPTAPLSKEN